MNDSVDDATKLDPAACYPASAIRAPKTRERNVGIKQDMMH